MHVHECRRLQPLCPRGALQAEIEWAHERAVQCHGQYAGPWAEAQKGLKESGLLDVPGVRFLENDEMPWPAAGLLWAREVRPRAVQHRQLLALSSSYRDKQLTFSEMPLRGLGLSGRAGNVCQ